MLTESATALVIAAHGGRGLLELADGRHQRYLVKGRRLRVVCGDRVAWRPAEDGEEAIVTGISPRRNALQRPSPGGGKPGILAANLTQVVVVAAPLPAPDLFLIDRYLCSATLMGCKVMLVFNKRDMEAGCGTREYLSIGYRVIECSAKTGRGLAALAGAINGQIAILVGQSGVGKSSLINALVPGSSVVTGAVSAATSEGIHTTTASVMHRLPGGGGLIDTPGVRDFVPYIDEARNVQTGFPEMVAVCGNCRFADCRHLREPDCAVKIAVSSGKISARRYESYKRLLRTVSA